MNEPKVSLNMVNKLLLKKFVTTCHVTLVTLLCGYMTDNLEGGILIASFFGLIVLKSILVV